MKKKLVGQINLVIAAGKANPAPPVGPALGQKGVNIMEFCKQFNERTKAHDVGIPIPVVINVYHDKSFDFITKTSPTSYHIRRLAGIASGSKTPGRANAGKITIAQVAEIAKIKMGDMGVDSLEAAMLMVKGSARSMGVEILE